MKKLYGVAAVLSDQSRQRLLLLHRVARWTGWEFLKGGVDEGETPEAAVKREIWEETKLEPLSLVPTGRTIVYHPAKDIERHLACFVGVANTAEVQISREHDEARWVTPEEARTMLTFPTLLPLLEDAQRLLPTLS